MLLCYYFTLRLVLTTLKYQLNITLICSKTYLSQLAISGNLLHILLLTYSPLLVFIEMHDNRCFKYASRALLVNLQHGINFFATVYVIVNNIL